MEQENVLKNLTPKAQEFNDKESSVVVYFTTKDVDRYGDIMHPEGMKVVKRPKVLWNHGNGGITLPIGKSLWEKPDETGVKGKIQFDTRSEAQEIYRLIKENIITDYSVWFSPLKYSELKDGGREYLEWELLEYGPVDVGVNPQAAITAWEKGLIKEETITKCLRESCKEFGEYLDLDNPLSVRKFNECKTGIETKLGEFEKLLNTIKQMEGNGIMEQCYEMIEMLNSKMDSMMDMMESKNFKPIETLAHKKFDKDEFIKSLVSGEVSRITGNITQR